jgi:hypothetical protein
VAPGDAEPSSTAVPEAISTTPTGMADPDWDLRLWFGPLGRSYVGHRKG